MIAVVETMMKTMSQVLKHPFQLVSAETGLVFASSLQPSEISSDDEPPGWAKRDEIWTIEELLGLYNSQEEKITIFNKGIEYIAQHLLVKPLYVEYIVRIHEWAHAGFHLGVDQNRSVELAKASLNDDKDVERVTREDLTGIYSSVDPYVHEQIAQSITWLALEKLRADATIDDAKEMCALLLETFKKLTLRQPKRYRLDQLQHLELIQFQKRLRDLIKLIRDGGVRGDQKTWDTIIPW
jgi:hypothetical protein